MIEAEYVVLFILVAVMGAGLPGPGDAALIAAGTLAGEGRLDVGVVWAISMAAWMLGSLGGLCLGSVGDAGCSTTRDDLRTRAESYSLRAIARSAVTPSLHR
jgi:membrane protein DedA with SNARE-associated domain